MQFWMTAALIAIATIAIVFGAWVIVRSAHALDDTESDRAADDAAIDSVRAALEGVRKNGVL